MEFVAARNNPIWNQISSRVFGGFFFLKLHQNALNLSDKEFKEQNLFIAENENFFNPKGNVWPLFAFLGGRVKIHFWFHIVSLTPETSN